MPEAKYLKCSCAHCGGHIEFPPEGAGENVPCPHCGQLTPLAIEVADAAEATNRRGSKWLIAGGVMLAVGAIALIAIFSYAHKLRRKARELSQPAPRPARVAPANPGTPSPQARPTPALLNGFATSAVSVDERKGTAPTYVRGTLKNESDKQRFGVTVEFELLDKSGRTIGNTKDYTDVIEPRAEWHYRALFLQPNVSSARITGIKEQ